MGDVAVRFANVSKRFILGQSHDSLYDLIVAGVGRVLGRRRRGGDDSTFLSLSDVSFELERGDAIGIIGPNGAGKSTVLKLLAGILRPDGGTITVNGRLSALIEVGAGFHGDLTGRENIFLNGAIMGMNRREIRTKLDAIVAFAGIERFLDMPVKRYSSGMYARLGFSIASHVDPDVLLVDEVLSVGDAVFRLRCIERMQALARGPRPRGSDRGRPRAPRRGPARDRRTPTSRRGAQRRRPSSPAGSRQSGSPRRGRPAPPRS